jgi:hypothetical protein
MKSPATPLILLVGCIILLINLCIHAVTLSIPYLQRFTIAAYRHTKRSVCFTRAYLKALLITVEAKASATAYYCLPDHEEGLIDTFLGVLMADLSWAIVVVSRLGGGAIDKLEGTTNGAVRSGRRICE